MIDKLKTLLNESKDPVQVSFTKVDGTIRNMLCTNNFDLIPKEFHPKTSEIPKTYNPNNVRVYDLENNGWRSFIGDKVISFETSEILVVLFVYLKQEE
jgi:hypothetical protein